MNEFKIFLKGEFLPSDIKIDEFKEQLHFIEIDFFKAQNYKLIIELSPENIKFATISRVPTIDFSLYDYVFEHLEEAKIFTKKIIINGEFPFRKL